MKGRPLNSTSALLLGLLSAGPRTGYQLAKDAEGVAPFWTVTRSQIYRELASMAEAALVRKEPSGPRDAQPYSITDSGREAFEEWVRTDPEPENLRIPLLLRLTFTDHLPRERIREMLTDHLAIHQRRLEEYEKLHTTLADLPELQRLTLTFGITYERAVLQWFADLPDDVRPSS